MNLVFTIAIGDHLKEIGKYTLPKIEEYAKKCGAKYVHYDNIMDYEEPVDVKFEIKHLLEDYDRVLYIDTDVVVSDDAPNLFDIVPEDKLGIYIESKHVPGRIYQHEHVWNLNKLEFDSCKYTFNSGVMLLSKCHKDIIELPKDIKLSDLLRFREQMWLNYLFRDEEVYDITHKFNHMDLSGLPEDGVYFRHYAAGDRKKLLELLKE